MALNILLRQQFLSGALVIGAISVETGLLVLNQCILSGKNAAKSLFLKGILTVLCLGGVYK